MVPLVVYRNVHVDDHSLRKHGAVWDAVTDDLIHTGAATGHMPLRGHTSGEQIEAEAKGKPGWVP